MIILMFLSARKYTKEEIMASLLFVLSLHALAIILSVIFPPFKDIIQPISQYSKELLRFRASGFLSGFDDAGMFCNFGMALHYMIRRRQGKGISALTVVFAIAAALTSRFNMAIMILVLLIVMWQESKNNKIMSKVIVSALAVIAIGFVGTFWILTTNVNITLRNQLLQAYPILNVFYKQMLGSYTDYGIYTAVVEKHLNPMPITTFERIVGMGLRITNSDIGYVKSMYSYGIIGIVWVFGFYLYSLKVIRRKYYRSTQSFLYFIYIICLVLMTMMETKTAIFLSSTSFEMLSIIYINFLINVDDENEEI
jgi:hypothetical protein